MEISPTQWERVKELFEAALERAPSERIAFLEKNAGDEVIRSEVSRLLAEHDNLEIVLSTPAFIDPRHPIYSRERLEPDEVWSGRFRIVNFIAAGGMGEVYRARDSKLARDVALKVLPQAFAGDANRLARFEREAKLLASLNHPNIAAIHGLEDSSGAYALVLELVEGPTLADRLSQGPIPIEEALLIAKQICDALEYAHERGIVHRDLKPANIKITPDDAVKVLDFGLAKAIESDPASLGISNSPTLSRMATQAGVLLGTAAYMSPEQAKGKVVDRRADIWAFGCVLHEMLTGEKAFPGETATDTLPAILKNDPDWSLLPAETPSRIRILVERCLQKDVKQRLQAIGEARIALEETLAGSPDSVVARPEQFASPKWRSALPWVLLFSTLAVLGWTASLYIRRSPAVLEGTVHRYEIAVPNPTVDFAEPSLDGTRLVFRNSRVPSPLWLGRMDSLDAHPIAGTDDAFGVPFWSPDGHFIAFSADGKLKKVDIEGDPPQILCDSGPAVIGGFWTSDGRIIFGDAFRPPGLWEVPESGGASSPLRTTDDGSEVRYAPVLLPGHKQLFLYANSPNGVKGDIYVGSSDGSARNPKKVLTQAFSNARYVPSQTDPEFGYLLYVRDGSTRTLVAQPFDLRKLELSGEPTPIAEKVYGFSASLTGIIIYGSGGAIGHRRLTLFDRQGKILGTVGDPGDYDSLAFSPDGSRLVAARFDFLSGSENLWMIDLARDVSTRFTFDSASDGDPVWSSDGNSIVFASNRGGKADTVYRRSSNGGGEDELLFKQDRGADPTSWSSDGRFLLFDTASFTSRPDQIGILPLGENGHATGEPTLFAPGGIEGEGQFSPASASHPRSIAYSSDESGRSEVYVRSFDPESPTGTPPSGAKWQISADGGLSPRWARNGTELLYVALDGTVMSVEVRDTAAAFRAGKPKRLFKPEGFSAPAKTAVYWDVSSDGKKFVFAVPPSANGAAAPDRLTVILNWTALLKK